MCINTESNKIKYNWVFQLHSFIIKIGGARLWNPQNVDAIRAAAPGRSGGWIAKCLDDHRL